MSTARYVLGWALATLLVTLAAWWVVAEASGGVNDASAAPLVVPTTSTSVDSPSTSQPPSTTSTIASTTSTAVPSSTSTSATSTTAPGSTTTSTTASSTSGVKTIASEGGTVTVSYGNGQVNLTGATPNIGYTVEIEDDGPEKVRVDFESEDKEISVRVEWKDGALDIQIEE